MKNFTATIEVANSPIAIFNHINNVSNWWAKKEFKGEFEVRAPVKLTTSVRSKLTTCFAGEDLSVHVC